MALSASLTSHVAPLQSSYLPGEVFKATWEVAYPASPNADANVAIQDVKISVIGSEVIDPKWVSQSYHAAQPAVHTSSRRVSRNIFHSQGTIATTSLVLRPGELRRTALSVPLPRALPPTFSGTALRFSYHVSVSWTAEFQSFESSTASAIVSAAAEAAADSAAGPSLDAPVARSASTAIGSPVDNGALTPSSADAPPPILSAAGIAAAERRRGAAAPDRFGESNGKVPGEARPDNGRSNVNGQDKSAGSSRSWFLPQQPAAAASLLAAHIGLSRTSSSSTAVPSATAATAAAAKSELLAATERRSAAVHSARTPFAVCIAPAEALPTVLEAESDAGGTPRAVALGRSASAATGGGGPSLGSGVLSGPIPSIVQAAYDPVHGPMIDFPMVPLEEAAPVTTEVLPAFQIGVEHMLWGSPPMAGGGHRFLWAPNEVDEAPSAAALSRPGSAAPMTPGGDLLAEPLLRELSLMESGDDSGAGAQGGTSDGEVLAIAPSASDGNFGSGSPAYRHSETGTPRVSHRSGGPPSDRSAGDPRVFHLAFRGGPLASIQLHTAQEGPLFPGCTFSVTVDFRGPNTPRARRSSCHQVVVVLETEEQVARDWLPAVVARRSSGPPCIRRPYQEAQEATLHSLFCSFMFTVPQEAPAAFRTPLLALRWCLRFEFVVTGPGSSKGLAPGKWPKEEELVWRMPLPVAPAAGVLIHGFG